MDLYARIVRRWRQFPVDMPARESCGRRSAGKKRNKVLLLVLIGAAVPCLAVKRVTVAQFEQTLASVRAKNDADAAFQIGDLQLTERLNPARVARLMDALPGEKSRQALTAVADASEFQAPPPAEIPATPAPDLAMQRRIMSLVVNYVGKTIPLLPNFFATRSTTRYEDTPQLQRAAESFIPYQPLHLAGNSSTRVLYQDGREVQEGAAVKAKTATPGLVSWGEFGPVLTTVLLDAAKSKLEWSRWEKDGDELRAVFRYDVPAEKSHYEVNYCCVAEQAGFSADTHPFRKIAGYRGEMAVDPNTGNVLRITVEAGLKNDGPVSQADILVDYGAIEIGGESYFCPIKSVSITTAEMIQHDEAYARPLANQIQPLKTMLNEARFENYHVFRSESRVLTAESGRPETALPSPTDTGNVPDPSPGTAGSAATETAAAATPRAEFSPRVAPASSEAAPAEISESAASDVPETAAHAQASAGSGFTLRTVTRLVDVGLVAYDKKGRPVTDLKAGDFDIYDNGRKQEIKYFGQAGGPAAPLAPAAQPATAAGSAPDAEYSNRQTEPALQSHAAQENHATVLLIDSSNLAWGDLQYARQEMLRFLSSLQAGDAVGLYVLRSYGFEVLLEPTIDHQQVAARLTRWMPSAQELARAQDEEQRNRQHLDWVTHSTDLVFVNGNDSTDPEGSASGQARAGLLAHGVDPQLRAMGNSPERDALNGLRTVARHLAANPGHKSLVWVSSDNVLADWSGQAADRAEKGSKFLDSLSLRAREALNEAHISIYPLDVSQLETSVITADLQNRLVQAKLDDPSPGPPPPPPAANPTGRNAALMHQDTHAIQGAFRDLAEATGGRALRRAGDIAAELNGIAEDGRAAYLLSFAPDAPADNQYHALTLKLTARHDLKLRYRTGYLYEKEPATLKERFQHAVWQPQDANEVGLTAVPSASAGSPALKLNIAATDLDMEKLDATVERREMWTDRIDIFLIERDDAAMRAHVTGRTLALRLRPETYQKVLREGIPFDESLPSKSGAGSLRVVIVDENSGRMGSVTVPAKAVVPSS